MARWLSSGKLEQYEINVSIILVIFRMKDDCRLASLAVCIVLVLASLASAAPSDPCKPCTPGLGVELSSITFLNSLVVY